MPQCGSQVTICDLPIRFDTYRGCSHACKYCFANRKTDISNVRLDESPNKLLNFINGKREDVTRFCDWDIPLHWGGGMSDPFQPAERVHKRSLECLKIFAETQYPFVVSTKSALIAEGEYFELIKKCNCVVQFSALCSKYDAWERGASTFAERVEAARKISPYKRVIIRAQPYIPEIRNDIKQNILLFKEAGVHGVIFESMKAQRKYPNMIKLGNDCVYPVELLKEHFAEFKHILHDKGMKFYCGENRLRCMSDELCCCGIEGTGFKPNTANLNHFLYDKDGYKFSEQMKERGTGIVFRNIGQSTVVANAAKGSYCEMMELASRTKNMLKYLIPKDIK